MTQIELPAVQAASVMALLPRQFLSAGTIRCYGDRLKQVAMQLHEQSLGSLHELTPVSAMEYLTMRASVLGQKTLDMERNALQAMMRHVTKRLEADQRLDAVKSTAPKGSKRVQGKPGLGRRLSKESRLYTSEQVARVAARQAPHNALATMVAEVAGLRAHELLTLCQVDSKDPDERPAHDQLFAGFSDDCLAYEVQSADGSVREVRLTNQLASQLEAVKLATPRIAKDRGIHFQQYYEIGGGQSWASSYGLASNAALGWSRGSYALRHGYAQRRLKCLQRLLPLVEAKRVVAIELGLSRPEKVNVYLR